MVHSLLSTTVTLRKFCPWKTHGYPENDGTNEQGFIKLRSYFKGLFLWTATQVKKELARGSTACMPQTPTAIYRQGALKILLQLLCSDLPGNSCQTLSRFWAGERRHARASMESLIRYSILGKENTTIHNDTLSSDWSKNLWMVGRYFHSSIWQIFTSTAMHQVRWRKCKRRLFAPTFFCGYQAKCKMTGSSAYNLAMTPCFLRKAQSSYNDLWGSQWYRGPLPTSAIPFTLFGIWVPPVSLTLFLPWQSVVSLLMLNSPSMLPHSFTIISCTHLERFPPDFLIIPSRFCSIYTFLMRPTYYILFKITTHPFIISYSLYPAQISFSMFHFTHYQIHLFTIFMVLPHLLL